MLIRSLILMLSSAAGGVVQGTCGFGCGILAMLGFSSYLSVPQAAAVTSIINFGITLPTTLRYRKHLTVKKIIVPFLVYTVSAMLIIRVSTKLDGALLKRVFGGFLLLLCVYHFTLAGKQPTRWTPLLCALAFIISGVGSGLFAVGGPMLVLYFLAHTDSTGEFLADTQLMMVLNAVPTLYMRITGGLLTAEHVPYLIPGLIGVLIGFWIAGKLVDRIDKPKLTKLVYIAIGVSGLLYLLGM
ncbi:MAG: sulfite exporter TauE/SafE family protein [Oscillospiraceae bacterium]|nr:sulfite exporter TauE/SafE family protein [Oscillospiraceae bacterium]